MDALALAPRYVEPDTLEVVEYDAEPYLRTLRDKHGRVASLRLTPELAAWLLSRNAVNRSVRRLALNTYKADLVAGRWTHSDSMICLDSAFNLRNGQHRCLAVVESGLSMPAVVMFDATDAEVMNMDAGVRRTNADILTFAGRKNSSLFAAGLRTVLAVRDARGLVSLRLARHELPELSERHVALEESCALFSHYNKSRIGISGPLIGVHYIAANYLDARDAADDFIRRVVGGFGEDATCPTYVLRNHLLRLAREPKTRSHEQAVFTAVVCMWNHFHAGRKIKSYRTPENVVIEGLDVARLR